LAGFPLRLVAIASRPACGEWHKQSPLIVRDVVARSVVGSFVHFQ